MLERPPSGRSERQRRWRQRQRDGKIVVLIEIDGPILDMLVRTHWLAERDAGSKQTTAAAIRELLSDMAQRG